ncbi:P-loop containing nucleoside triphosphate hydrolase protein, partial [Rhizophagus irregularis]
MKKIFEFNEFREGQLEAIISYLNGKDTFVFMKTGGGKTLCYAISAVCFNGLTIVFSPLKALMKDQKRELIKAGVPCATLYANLAQGACVQEKIFEEIACGLIKVLFVTPEKLVSNEGFCRFITRLYEQQKVRFVIDEAHCIIAYQDFREAWGRLGILKQHWKLAPIMLLTATCTQPEVDEIRANLTIEKDNFAIIRSSTSHRPEMIFNVQERKEIRDQYINDIIDIINANLLGRIIIYCATHFSCEYLYNKLQENLTDVSLGYFHGGLCDDERETTMNNWTSNQIQIMVATSAFGMGINSSNIRVVIHVGAPMSITNLIQEAGRAGRDGNTATNVIFYSKKD